MRDSEHFSHAMLAVALAIFVALAVVLCVACPSSAQTQSITVDAVRASGDLTLFAGTNLVLNPTGDVVVNPVGNDAYPLTNYDINLGLITNKWLSLHAAELWVETLVAQDTIATIGGRILVGPTTTLTMDMTDSQTYVCVKHNEMGSGDRVVMESYAGGAVKLEFMAVTSTPTTDHASCNGTVTDYYYTVTRNLDGTGGNVWYAGDAVFNTGGVGDGYLDLYSFKSLASRRGNLVLNPSAETDTSNWSTVEGTNGTLSRITSPVYDGSGAFKIDLTTSADGIGFGAKCITVVPGKKYLAYVFARGSGASTDGLYVRINEDSNQGCGAIDYVTSTYRESYTAIAENVAIPTSYTQYYLFYTPPTGVTAISLSVYNWQPNSDVDVYFDGVWFSEVDAFGPTIAGNVRVTTDYNGIMSRWAVGNLNGVYGYSSSTYGAAFGDPTDAFVSIDDTYGIRMIEGRTHVRGWWFPSGDLIVGEVGAGLGNVYITAGGTLYIRSNETAKITLDTSGNIAMDGSLTVGTNGAIMGGATGYSAGTGFFIGYSSGYKFRVGNASSGQRIQWDGSNLTVHARNLLIDDDNGVTVAASSTRRGFKFDTCSNAGMTLDQDDNALQLNTCGSGAVYFAAGSTATLGITTSAIYWWGSNGNVGLTGSGAWDEIYVDIATNDSATYPVVIDDSTNKFGQKTDGTNGTFNGATNGVATLTVEYGIITGYTCR